MASCPLHLVVNFTARQRAPTAAGTSCGPRESPRLDGHMISCAHSHDQTLCVCWIDSQLQAKGAKDGVAKTHWQHITDFSLFATATYYAGHHASEPHASTIQRQSSPMRHRAEPHELPGPLETREWASCQPGSAFGAAAPLPSAEFCEFELTCSDPSPSLMGHWQGPSLTGQQHHRPAHCQQQMWHVPRHACNADCGHWLGLGLTNTSTLKPWTVQALDSGCEAHE